jgi:hypothetical protein
MLLVLLRSRSDIAMAYNDANFESRFISLNDILHQQSVELVGYNFFLTTWSRHISEQVFPKLSCTVKRGKRCSLFNILTVDQVTERVFGTRL